MARGKDIHTLDRLCPIMNEVYPTLQEYSLPAYAQILHSVPKSQRGS